jgi:hypothetical protein
MNAQIKKAAEFLADQAGRMAFGEVSVKVIVHNGIITRTERTITEKIQTDEK